ncbi:hypothetical protein LPB140_10415 [Sphingorhabdus lutea]|uniref:Uncharacterized protein n=1 Tax=Sphingorhabdus lutea TaxID=1913578 RepID=A0A1L3JDC7_9SPHN|nr:hypothetical protein [Sphingorhabdus lutea]APG63130.1 hypothetical protein LPB140_10415 [Sphingorhabdus lutea]
MDKKTPPVSPSFNHAVKSHDGKGTDSNSSGRLKPQKPEPKLTFEMKGEIGRASRALSFYRSNSALSKSSGNGDDGNVTVGTPRGSSSGNSPKGPSGLKETFNPAAKGNNGNDHSR